MPGIEVKSSRPVPLSQKDQVDSQTHREKLLLDLDIESAGNLLDQLRVVYDDIPQHALLVRDDWSKVICTKVRHAEEILPLDDFAAIPRPRNGESLKILLARLRKSVKGRPQHEIMMYQVAIIDRTSARKVFGLEELTGVAKTDYGWKGMLKNGGDTEVYILSKRVSSQGIAELIPLHIGK
ncbi:MAG: hypothetical protein G01um10145_112 [Microgenomates group bacterium Gr01-1014_5]|nr:MAG: hypothetical protein G01um10145_112 [Microgenomates group bacterium Gr01-1014_5]